MKIQVISVYDAKTKVFGQPQYFINVPTALRSWGDTANNPNDVVHKHPEDYTLFHLGEYDDETGTFTNLTTPNPLGTALQYKQQEQ